MRTAKYTSRFKRDDRREKSGLHGKQLDALLMEVVNPWPRMSRCLDATSITN